MGNYATLSFGGIVFEEFKSEVPLVALLMFAQSDLLIEELSNDKAVEASTEWNDEYDRTYRFVTTAETAKRRMNEKGIDVSLCRNLFDEFRSSTIRMTKMRVSGDGSKPTSESYEVANTIDFTEYYDSLKAHLYSEISDAPLHSAYRRSEIKHDDGSYDLVMGGSIFIDGGESDATVLLRIRVLLELAENDMEIELDISDLVAAEYIKEDEVPSLIDAYLANFRAEMEIDYKLYRFILEDDPSVSVRLRSRIAGMSENQFLRHVMFPLLEKMGFEHVRQNNYHGPGEHGSDILPFRTVTPFGTMEYYAVQTKAVTIHGSSSKSGNAAELLSQARQALDTAFVDDLDNERKRIDKFVIAANKTVTPDARRYIESAIEANRRLIFLDIDKIVDLIKKHHLVQYILLTGFN